MHHLAGINSSKVIKTEELSYLNYKSRIQIILPQIDIH
jgi:hypothetical protein